MAYKEPRAGGSEPSDEALMARVCAGDGEALARLVKRYEGPLYGYLRRMVGNAEDAEDLFQETFLRVHARSQSFRGGATFRPWLYRIATNVARDRLRYRRRHPVEPLEPKAEIGEVIADRHAGPAERTENAELAERLAAAVAELPVKHRAVFLMARYDGMAYEEIARALRVPVGTVKSRMNKAAGFLMDRLKEFRP
jgi:RNA polymerase sigma-70 factor (ECF subfamily)